MIAPKVFYDFLGFFIFKPWEKWGNVLSLNKKGGISRPHFFRYCKRIATQWFGFLVLVQ